MGLRELILSANEAATPRAERRRWLRTSASISESYVDEYIIVERAVVPNHMNSPPLVLRQRKLVTSIGFLIERLISGGPHPVHLHAHHPTH